MASCVVQCPRRSWLNTNGASQWPDLSTCCENQPARNEDEANKILDFHKLEIEIIRNVLGEDVEEDEPSQCATTLRSFPSFNYIPLPIPAGLLKSNPILKLRPGEVRRSQAVAHDDAQQAIAATTSSQPGLPCLTAVTGNPMDLSYASFQSNSYANFSKPSDLQRRKMTGTRLIKPTNLPKIPEQGLLELVRSSEAIKAKHELNFCAKDVAPPVQSIPGEKNNATHFATPQTPNQVPPQQCRLVNQGQQYIGNFPKPCPPYRYQPMQIIPHPPASETVLNMRNYPQPYVMSVEYAQTAGAVPHCQEYVPQAMFTSCHSVLQPLLIRATPKYTAPQPYTQPTFSHATSRPVGAEHHPCGHTHGSQASISEGLNQLAKSQFTSCEQLEQPKCYQHGSISDQPALTPTRCSKHTTPSRTFAEIVARPYRMFE